MLKINQYVQSVNFQVMILSDLYTELDILLKNPDYEPQQLSILKIKIIARNSELHLLTSLSETITECLSKLDPKVESFDLTEIKGLIGDLLDQIFNIYNYHLGLNSDHTQYLLDKINETISCVESFLKGFYYSNDEENY